jgi:hypothetical protein
MGARSLFVAAMVCTLVLSASGYAAPILYDESVGGDLPAAGSPLTTFTLDAGLNTVSGTTGNAPTEFDSFAFTVPAGMQVTAANVTLADVSGNLSFVKWSLNQGSADAGVGTLLGVITSASPGSASFPGLPLLPDTYNLTAGASMVGSGTSSYTFSLTVVPEPTGLALAGCFAGAALLRRRCRRPSAGR